MSIVTVASLYLTDSLSHPGNETSLQVCKQANGNDFDSVFSCSMPYQPGQVYNPQQAAYASAQAAATPWAQYPYQQAYGAAAAQVGLYLQSCMYIVTLTV